MKITKAWLFAALLAVGMFACGGDDDDDDDTPDAAPTPDASVMPDAEPPIDADVTPDAVPPGEMTLTVIDDKTVLEDLDVVFSNRDGTIISHQKTDTNGEVTETVPGRAFVTILNTELPGVGPTLYFSYTLGGVMPGDNITIDVTELDFFGGDDIGSLAGTVTIDWPGEHTGATEYQATDGCETATEPDPGGGDPLDTTAEVYTGCIVPGGGTNWHIVASAFMSGGMFGGDTLAATYVKNVSASDTVTLPAWNTNFDGLSVTVGNAPKGVLGVIGNGEFTLDGVTYDTPDGDFLFGGGGSYDVMIPQGFGPDSTIANTLLAFGAGMSLSGFGSIQASQTGLGSDLSYDLVADALPGATDGVVTAGARPLLSWIEGGDMSAARIAQMTFEWDDVNEEHRWIVVTDPGDATPFQLPELPAALVDYEPSAATDYNQLSAIYLDADYLTDDWDTIRENGGALRQFPADANFVQRFSIPFFADPMPPAEALPAMNRRLHKTLFGR